VIQTLVQRGNYEIRGTVRSLSGPVAQDLLESFPNLKLYEADLLVEGSFDTVVAGATVVFHTASPVGAPKTDPKKEFVDPAVNGTLNVLRSAEKAYSVKRVVVTSSAVAIADIAKADSTRVYSENDWNETADLATSAYSYGKTLAEKSAWEFSKGKHFELIVANPGFVFGPVITKRSTQTSVSYIAGALKGAFADSGIPNVNYPIVDVRDLGELHVRLAESKNAHGRNLISSETSVPLLDLIKILRNSAKYSKFNLPTKYSEGQLPVNTKYNISKIQKELGITLRPVEQTILDTADSLVKFGLVANL